MRREEEVLRIWTQGVCGKCEEELLPLPAHPSRGHSCPNPPIYTDVNMQRKGCKGTLRIQTCVTL